MLFCFSNTMKTILFVITVCLLVHMCNGCSVWNRNRPCRCLCEDTNTYCKKACYNMCFGKICTATEKIEQSRCYSQCEQTFTICFNSCSSRIWWFFRRNWFQWSKIAKMLKIVCSLIHFIKVYTRLKFECFIDFFLFSVCYKPL